MEAADNRGGVDNWGDHLLTQSAGIGRGERAETTNDGTIRLLTTHETRIPNENGPA
jgi:hypothetical protein